MSQTNVYNCNECINNINEDTNKEIKQSCKGCQEGESTYFNKFMTYKKIQKQTNISQSTYLNNLNPFEVTKKQNYLYQGLKNYAKVSSDREHPSLNKVIINRNTSSLKGSKTSLKPGSLSAGGIGVDIKHNSYDRYLAKLKAKSLKPITTDTFNVNSNISIFQFSKKDSKCAQKCE